jgi:hypothetical protein
MMYTYDRRTASSDDLVALLQKALVVHQKLRTWIGEFPTVLRKSKLEATDLSDGLVWQDRFVLYWDDLDVWRTELEDIADQIETLAYSSKTQRTVYLYYSVQTSLQDKAMPDKARVEYAFGAPKFEFSEKLQRKHHIAYEVSRLTTWAEAFEAWSVESDKALKAALKKARVLARKESV